MRPYGRKIQTSPFKVHNRFISKNSYILPQGGAAQLFKELGDFKFWILANGAIWELMFQTISMISLQKKQPSAISRIMVTRAKLSAST